VAQLLRKAAGGERSQPRREAMRAAASKAIGIGLPKTFRAQITPLFSLDARHVA
jgi:hypothetical protein